MPTVDFDLPDDPNGTVAKAHVPMIANGDPVDGMNADGTITDIVVDDPGSGYSTRSGRHGPQRHRSSTRSTGPPPATATQPTSSSSAVTVDRPRHRLHERADGDRDRPDRDRLRRRRHGGRPTSARSRRSPSTAPGDGYLSTGIKKFQDELPVTCNPGTDGAGCPLATRTPRRRDRREVHPDWRCPRRRPTTASTADEYVIGLVQYRTKFSCDLPPTLVRGYVQLSTAAVPGQQVPLVNELLDGTRQPIAGYTGVDLAAVARPDHRRHQGQAGADRLPQPAAHRCRR